MTEKALFSAVKRRLGTTTGLVAVLKPDLTVVGTSESYVRATLLWRERVEGRSILDVFPNNPNDPESDGRERLRDSLEYVIAERVPHHMAIQRYDVRDYVSDSTRWVEKHWNPVNTPVFGRGSKEITHLVHQVTDVTEAVLLRRWIEEQSIIVEEQRATVEQMLGDLNERQSVLRAACAVLPALNRPMQPCANSVEEIRRLLKAPESRLYFQVGEMVPARGVYTVFHRTDCALVSRTIFMEAGAIFPKCFRCGTGALYRPIERFCDPARILGT